VVATAIAHGAASVVASIVAHGASSVVAHGVISDPTSELPEASVVVQGVFSALSSSLVASSVDVVASHATALLERSSSLISTVDPELALPVGVFA